MSIYRDDHVRRIHELCEHRRVEVYHLDDIMDMLEELLSWRLHWSHPEEPEMKSIGVHFDPRFHCMTCEKEFPACEK